MKEYLVRASLEYTWDLEQESKSGQLTRPYNLPISIGPFQLDQSPNIEFYLAELGWIGLERVEHKNPDWYYPVSLLYVEKKVQVPDKSNPQARADDVLESFECLLRLFQPGGVSIRRNRYMPRVEGQQLKNTIFFGGPPTKPVTATLYERQPYAFDDHILDKFIRFFNKYWDVLEESPSHLTTALTRFNSSYEKHKLADRLIDLVIALEALFGDGDSDSTTYKIALRCASWLHPPGNNRHDAFEFAKKSYTERSKVVHGRRQASTTKEQVDGLEAMVRSSLVKFLDSRASGVKTPNGKEIDSLMMTGKI